MFHLERFKKLLFLTLGLFIFSFQVNVSCEEINPVINQVSMKDNLRLEIYIPKDALLVQKTGNFLTLAILKSPYFDVLSKKIESIQINKQYIKGLKLKKPQNPSDVPSIEFELLGDQV
jgi:hypothetical protein